MLQTYIKLLRILSASERQRLYLVLAASLVAAIFDTFGVAVILPFLSIAADPDRIQEIAILRNAYAAFGFESEFRFILSVGLLVLLVILAGFLLRAVSVYLLSSFGHMRNFSLSTRLFRHFLGKNHEWSLRQNSASLAREILFDVDKIVNGALLQAMRMFSQSVTLVLVAILLLVLEPLASLLVASLVGGGYILVFYLVRKSLVALGVTIREENDARYRTVQDSFGALKDVKILGLEEIFWRRFYDPTFRFARAARMSQLIAEVPRNLLEALAFGSIIVLVLFLVDNSENGAVDLIPTLGLFAAASLKMFPSIQLIYHSITEMRVASAILNEAFPDLVEARDSDLPPVGTSSPGTEPTVAFTSSFEIRSVSFAYSGSEETVLDRISLSFPRGAIVALVGESGSGKSTIADIILSLLEPTEGAIWIDGQPLTRDRQQGWRRRIGYVPQTIYLSDASIAGNIAFGLPRAQWNLAAIERAARQANLHDFVTGLPEGYDTEVGERGVRLSGGQRQRIGIARALYRDPDVLVFDEATSALDNLTERAVMEAVNNLGRQKTIIMIAHRLSTVRNCDTIFLLEKGRLVAQGTYDDLVATNETFRSMAEG